MQDLKSSEPLTPFHHSDVSSGGEVDLFAFVLLLRRNLRRIVLWALCTFLLMVAFTLTARPRFSALASLLIPQQNTSSSAAALAVQATTGLDVAGGSTSAVYVDMLRSRTVADRLIDRFKLKNRYQAKLMMSAEKILAARTTITGEKDGLILIAVQDEEPDVAANMANAYISELDLLNQHLAISAAALQRRYFEQEMVKEKNQLADAEVALRELQEHTGVIEPQLQAQSGMTAADTTRAQLRSREVALGALLQGATPQNPDVIRLQAEIAGLESQLRAMQTGGGIATPTPSIKAPGYIMAYVRQAREVKYHEALFEMLSRQYETAKEQEAKDFSMIEVLDEAKAPERKAWPPRTLYCLMALFGGGLLGVLYTLGEALVGKVLQNPANQERLRALKRNYPSAASKTVLP